MGKGVRNEGERVFIGGQFGFEIWAIYYCLNKNQMGWKMKNGRFFRLKGGLGYCAEISIGGQIGLLLAKGG